MILLALLGLLCYWLFNTWINQRQLSRLEAVLTDEPGVVLTAAESRGNRFLFSGLRDPLARDISEIVAGVDIEPSRVHMQFRPYQSLEQTFVMQRLRQVVESGEVELAINDQQLIVDGATSAAERQKLLTLAPTFGLRRVVFSVDDEVLLARVIEATQPPNGVQVAVADGNVVFTGSASLSWIRATKPVAEGIQGLASVSFDGLDAQEAQEFERLMAQLETQDFSFVRDVTLARGEMARLLSYADDAERLYALGLLLDRKIIFAVVGHTDETGTQATNDRLAAARATLAEETLRRKLPSSADIRLSTNVPAAGAQGQRQVAIAVRYE